MTTATDQTPGPVPPGSAPNPSGARSTLGAAVAGLEGAPGRRVPSPGDRGGIWLELDGRDFGPGECPAIFVPWGSSVGYPCTVPAGEHHRADIGGAEA